MLIYSCMISPVTLHSITFPYDGKSAGHAKFVWCIQPMAIAPWLILRQPFWVIDHTSTYDYWINEGIINIYCCFPIKVIKYLVCCRCVPLAICNFGCYVSCKHSIKRVAWAKLKEGLENSSKIRQSSLLFFGWMWRSYGTYPKFFTPVTP